MLAAYPGAVALAGAALRGRRARVAAGEVAAGVLPIENVVGGGVREVYDLLLDSQAVVVGEVIVPVRLCLAALPGQRLEDIERVYSHIQALAQAEPFLRSRPWTLLAATNTAGSGKHDRRPRRARLGGRALAAGRARSSGWRSWPTDIQAERSNRTRFLVLARPERPELPVPATAVPMAAAAAPSSSRCATSRARSCARSASSPSTAST